MQIKTKATPKVEHGFVENVTNVEIFLSKYVLIQWSKITNASVLITRVKE